VKRANGQAALGGAGWLGSTVSTRHAPGGIGR
jgi:hypothetical protein